MAKKKATKKRVTGTRQRRGLILVRNVDLDIWEEFKALAASQKPEAKLGPFLTETMRERIEREKSSRLPS